MILTGREAAAMIDISAVRTHHGYSDIEEVVALAKKYRFINVHVLPCWVKETAEMLKGVDGVYVGSPVGFPAGAATTLTKKYGEAQAWKWESSGAEGYTVTEAERIMTPAEYSCRPGLKSWG